MITLTRGPSGTGTQGDVQTHDRSPHPTGHADARAPREDAHGDGRRGLRRTKEERRRHPRPGGVRVDGDGAQLATDDGIVPLVRTELLLEDRARRLGEVVTEAEREAR